MLQRGVVDVACHGVLLPVLNLADALLWLTCSLIGKIRCMGWLRRLWTGVACKELKSRSRPTVVIVGGSFAGLHAARDLNDQFDVTLVDFKDYFEYTPGTPRLFVKPTHLNALTGPLPSKHNRLIVAEVLEASATELQLRHPDGQTSALSFDYLLIGLGSTYTDPWKPSANEPQLPLRRETWRAAAVELERASSAIVIGGGPVGVELAAEIAAARPELELTLVSRSARLCAGMPAGVHNRCKEWLERRGVRLLLGAKVKRMCERGCTLADGTELDADVLYRCTGFRPNTAALSKHFKERLNEDGALVVNDQLQVKPRVYAMGDAIVHPPSSELKLGHTAELNAALVVENVRRQHRGEALLSYPDAVVGNDRSPRVFCVSLGPHHGVVVFNSVVLGGVLAPITKWILEWTKVAACAERPIGIFFWKFADWFSCFLSKTVLPPPEADSS